MKAMTVRWITACAFLATCLYAAPRAIAENPTILTPQEKAVSDHNVQLYHEAVTAMNTGNYALAASISRKTNPAGYFDKICDIVLAAALNAQGKNTEALEAYKELADRGSDSPDILLPYALLLLKSGQYSQAADAYNKALPMVAEGGLLRANGPFSSDASPSKDLDTKDLETAIHTALGLTWTGNGLWDGSPNYAHALDEFSQALRLSPDNALANLYKGQVLVRLGCPAQARDAFARATRLGDADVRKAAAEGRPL